MKTKIIAEIGINHNGSLDIAKRLIEEAARAGAHFVKFQKRNPDVCVPEHQKEVLRETPWGEMRYIDYKKEIEFGTEEYDYLHQIAKDNNIELFFSIWDEDSLNFVLNYESDYIKIPSALCTDIDMIKKCKKTKRKVIVSTGMTEWNDILKVTKIFEDDPSKLILMHCVSEYPPKNPFLGTIYELKKIHDIIGYSSHDLDIQIPIATTLLGITYIERHITLDKSMWGTDHRCSSDISELKSMIHGIDKFETFKTSKQNITHEELKQKYKMNNNYDK